MKKNNTKLKAWTTLSSEIAHENKWYKIRHDKLVLPNGKTGDYYILDHVACVYVIPVKDGNILLGRQYRYPIKRYSIELPGGGMQPNRTLLQTAKEELHEEVGYSGKLKKIGSFFTINGVSNEKCHVFIASELKFIGTKLETSEKITTVEVLIDDAYRMIENGKIVDGMTIAALTIAKKYLVKPNKLKE